MSRSAHAVLNPTPTFDVARHAFKISLILARDPRTLSDLGDKAPFEMLAVAKRKYKIKY